MLAHVDRSVMEKESNHNFYKHNGESFFVKRLLYNNTLHPLIWLRSAQLIEVLLNMLFKSMQKSDYFKRFFVIYIEIMVMD